MDQKAIAVVTGDVGSGKSTSLALCLQYMPFKSEHELITIVGGNYSPMELYRQILLNFRHELHVLPGFDDDHKDSGNSFWKSRLEK
jgi:energy-coupling factor transporter ATP-binding protein EcfA2